MRARLVRYQRAVNQAAAPPCLSRPPIPFGWEQPVTQVERAAISTIPVRNPIKNVVFLRDPTLELSRVLWLSVLAHGRGGAWPAMCDALLSSSASESDSAEAWLPTPNIFNYSSSNYFSDPPASIDNCKVYEMEGRNGWHQRHPEVVALFTGDWKGCGLGDVAWLRDASIAFRIAMQGVVENSADSFLPNVFSFGRRVSFTLATRHPKPVCGMVPFSVMCTSVASPSSDFYSKLSPCFWSSSSSGPLVNFLESAEGALERSAIRKRTPNPPPSDAEEAREGNLQYTPRLGRAAAAAAAQVAAEEKAAAAAVVAGGGGPLPPSPLPLSPWPLASPSRRSTQTGRATLTACAASLPTCCAPPGSFPCACSAWPSCAS